MLRRKGPNGTVLSGATPTTDLGGGSVYKDVGDEEDGTTVVTESTALSGITAGASDLAAREKRRQKHERRERERRGRRADDGSTRQREPRRVGQDGAVTDQREERAAQKELRSYRHEKPARVGGLNKQSEGSSWDGSTNAGGSTNAAESTAASSELLSNRQATPTRASPAIRKVHSTTERERIRGEARRLRDEGRAARRDFSFQRPGGAESALSESLLEGGSELGTKSYHHPMPELREHGEGDKDALQPTKDEF